METQLPLPQKGDTALQFSVDDCCGQAAGWIKMPHGTMLGLGPGNIVLDSDPAPPQGAQHPKFRPMSVVVKRLDDKDVTWYEGRPRPRPHRVTWEPSFPLPKGAQPPIFGPCLLWPNGRPSQLLMSSCYRMHLTAKFRHFTFNRSEVIVLANKQTDKQTNRRR